MAVSNVSTVDMEQWQLINTATATSGTSVTAATGIAGFKKLLVVWKLVQWATNSFATMTFNSDTTTGNYIGGTYAPGLPTSSASYSNLYLDAAATTGVHNGYIVIDNIAASAPKVIRGATSNDSATVQVVEACWNNTAALTSIQFASHSGATFSNAYAATISVYGIVA